MDALSTTGLSKHYGNVVAVAAKVLTKSERTTQNLDRYRCQSVGIRVDHEQKIELDGDIIGEATHVEIEVQAWVERA